MRGEERRGFKNGAAYSLVSCVGELRREDGCGERFRREERSEGGLRGEGDEACSSGFLSLM